MKPINSPLKVLAQKLFQESILSGPRLHIRKPLKGRFMLRTINRSSLSQSQTSPLSPMVHTLTSWTSLSSRIEQFILTILYCQVSLSWEQIQTASLLSTTRTLPTTQISPKMTELPSSRDQEAMIPSMESLFATQ